MIGTVPTGVQIPPEEFKVLHPDQHRYMDKLQSDGKIVLQHELVCIRGGVTVYDVESNNELDRIIRQSPLFRFFEYKIYPLRG